MKTIIRITRKSIQTRCNWSDPKTCWCHISKNITLSLSLKWRNDDFQRKINIQCLRKALCCSQWYWLWQYLNFPFGPLLDRMKMWTSSRIIIFLVVCLVSFWYDSVKLYIYDSHFITFCQWFEKRCEHIWLDVFKFIDVSSFSNSYIFDDK